MSYRSNVYIMTTKDGYKTYCKKSDYFDEVDQLISSKKNPDFYEERGEFVLFGFYDINWHYSFFDIDNFNHVLEDSYVEDGIPYIKTIFGEDYDDISQEYCDNEWELPEVKIVRTLDIDW